MVDLSDKQNSVNSVWLRLWSGWLRHSTKQNKIVVKK